MPRYGILQNAVPVWSGGYGVQRKVTGAEQGLDPIGKVASMGLMGQGGLIAVIGGVMFLVIVLSTVTNPCEAGTSRAVLRLLLMRLSRRGAGR